VVLDGLPLFLGHLEGVRAIDHETLWFEELFINSDESLIFPLMLEEDGDYDDRIGHFLGQAGPVFGVPDCFVFEEIGEDAEFYLAPHNNNR
jgi:hypothetical protein